MNSDETDTPRDSTSGRYHRLSVFVDELLEEWADNESIIAAEKGCRGQEVGDIALRRSEWELIWEDLERRA